MNTIRRDVFLSWRRSYRVVMLLAAVACVAQAQQNAAVPATPEPFHYVVNPAIVQRARMFRETDGTLHPVALVRDHKGVISAFVEDEIVVCNEPAEVAALVEKYHARVLREIKVNLTSAEGKRLPPAHTTPRVVLQLDASSSPLRLEEEALALKAEGGHVFSTGKSANLAAIMAHERAAGHSVQLNFLGERTDFHTSSKEQADQNGVDDAYKWPEFDHRAWQYVLDAGIKMNPMVAIIDFGFWLDSHGVPCGYHVDALCQTTEPAAGNSDLPYHILQGDTDSDSFVAAGVNQTEDCKGDPDCIWHGNGSASVALGKLNNKTGAAGMGGPVAIPMLIKSDSSISGTSADIEAAVNYGASIISLSIGLACNFWCRSFHDLTSEPTDAIKQGVLVVASAGNDAQDAGNEYFWPCIFATLCVGAMNPNADQYGYFTHMDGTAVSYSNYGSSVTIWAPTNIHVMPNGATHGALMSHTGTSAAAPYVAGVAALMKAVNPSVTAAQIAQLMVMTGLPGVVDSNDMAVMTEPGPLIQPLYAVMAANGAKPMKPQIRITSPTDHATVGEVIWHAVTFTAEAEDILAGSWPVSGQPPVMWSSSVDGPMGSGNSIKYVFSPQNKAGDRIITATVKNSQTGLSASDSITVDFEPVIGGPIPSIVYPPAGSTFAAGTIQVRGTARSAVSLGNLTCDRLVWQAGIAPTPIPSTTYGGASAGVCQADVPFQASAGQQPLWLTATDTTGKVASIAELLTITAPSNKATVNIDEPTANEAFTFYTLYKTINIGLHAFVQNAPPNALLTYTWSWYPESVGPNGAQTIGTGQSFTWSANVCGPTVVRVVVTSPSIPAGQNPTAEQNIQVICTSSQ